MADALVFKMEGVSRLQKFMLNYRKEKRRRLQRATLLTAHRIRGDYIQRLQRMKVDDTGKLRQSIKADSRDGWRSAEIGATATHAPFIEKGTKPHFPPSKALEPWVRRKARGGRRRPGSAIGRNRLENEVKGIAFVIARKISRKGTKARPALLPAAQKFMPIYLRDIRNIFK